MKALTLIVLLAVVTMPCMIKAARAESQAPSASIEPQVPSDTGQKLVHQIRLQLQKAISIVKDSELDELDAKFKADPYYYMKVAGGDRNAIIPVLLAGVKRRPGQPYFVAALLGFQAQDQFTARGLAPDQKKEHYQYTLAYIQETLDIIQTPPKPDPNQKNSDDLPAGYQSMLQRSLALAAIETGDLSLSKQMSEKSFKENTEPNSGDYGDVIHEANTILGRVALRQNDLEMAKQYLLKSGKTPGSAVLKSYGPSFILARELLERGQKEVVLEYLDLVAAFWGNPEKERPQLKMLAEEIAQLLSKWKQEIKDGNIPSDVPRLGIRWK